MNYDDDDEFDVLHQDEHGWQICALKPKPIHKRVPASMASEYTANGWVIAKREGRTVVLVWPKDTQPQ